MRGKIVQNVTAPEAINILRTELRISQFVIYAASMIVVGGSWKNTMAKITESGAAKRAVEQ